MPGMRTHNRWVMASAAVAGAVMLGACGSSGGVTETRFSVPPLPSTPATTSASAHAAEVHLLVDIALSKAKYTLAEICVGILDDPATAYDSFLVGLGDSSNLTNLGVTPREVFSDLEARC